MSDATGAPSQPRKALPRKLNLGCGEDYREGWWNVDVTPRVEADEHVDLDETPWPWPDGHFERIEARHVLEHLENPIAALHEAGRVLEPRGKLTVVYPIGHTRFEDITHQDFWNWHSAWMMDGARAHAHELDLPFLLVERSADWHISQPEPLVVLYTRYRLWMSGPGPWLEQVPGVYGEIEATFRKRPSRGTDA